MPTMRDRIAGFINPKQEESKTGKIGRVPQLHGQRARLTSMGNETSGGFDFGGSALDKDKSWRTLNLDDRTLDRVGTAELIELLIDLSPDISAALWYFIRFCNPGWQMIVRVPDGASNDPHEIGQAALDDFEKLLSEYYGAVDVVYNALFMSGFITGGFCAELVINNAGTEPIDLVVIDGNQVSFKKVKDPDRGMVWQLGQYQGVKREWVPLDVPTVGYVGVDPAPGQRKGRPIATAALFSSIFLLTLLHDLRRVIAQQGYPRIDLSINIEALRDAMSDDIEDDPEALKKWIDETIDGVAEVYGKLQPDDAYVHTDVVDVKGAVGTVDAKSLGAVDGMIRALERMIVKGLKTMPLLMGSNESTAESHANRQWEVYVAGIKSFQHLAEQLLERLLGEALQVLGIAAEVEFKFAELRASEQLRDAQTESIKIANEKAKYDQGWTSQDEGSLEITGHAADEETPRVIDLAGGTDLISGDIAESGLTDPAMAGNDAPMDGEESGDQGEDRGLIARLNSNGNGSLMGRVVTYDQVDGTGTMIAAGAFDEWLEETNGATVPVRVPSATGEALNEFRDARAGLEAIIEKLV